MLKTISSFFTSHLGITPSGLALAKSLLNQNNLVANTGDSNEKASAGNTDIVRELNVYQLFLCTIRV